MAPLVVARACMTLVMVLGMSRMGSCLPGREMVLLMPLLLLVALAVTELRVGRSACPLRFCMGFVGSQVG